MQLFYLFILDKLLMVFREVGFQNSNGWILQTTGWMIPCFYSNKITFSKQSTFNVFGTTVISVSANFESTCVNICIYDASNFKVFPIRMFFVINTRFFTIKTLALNIEQSRVRSPGNTLTRLYWASSINLFPGRDLFLK